MMKEEMNQMNNKRNSIQAIYAEKNWNEDDYNKQPIDEKERQHFNLDEIKSKIGNPRKKSKRISSKQDGEGEEEA